LNFFPNNLGHKPVAAEECSDNYYRFIWKQYCI